MKSVDFRRVFIISGLTSLIVVYAVLWLRMISNPTERTGSDFISTYKAGRVADRWGAVNVYSLESQQAVQAEVVGFELAPGQVLMFNHPPYLGLCWYYSWTELHGFAWPLYYPDGCDLCCRDGSRLPADPFGWLGD